MLITTCAHCRARFRVTPQQLNAKQGQVRCGSCQKVFNGFEALQRFPDDDTGGRLLAAAERAAGIPPSAAPPPQVEALRFEELPDIDGLDPPEAAQVPDGRVGGQADGGHADSSRTPAVREVGPKGAGTGRAPGRAQVGRALPADRWRPARAPEG